MRMSNLIAECLILIEKEELAVNILDIICNAPKIFEQLDLIEEKKKTVWRTDLEGKFKHLVWYMNLAKDYGRN